MTVRLAATKYDTQDHPGAVPVAILHGLFGSGRNWASIAQRLAARHPVIAFDLRNHGASAWAGGMQYGEMAEDVLAMLDERGYRRAALLGHSMGGKVAMAAALRDPDMVERLAVVDIAPVAYRPHHLGLVQAMRALDLTGIQRRGEADAALAAAVPDVAERGFLLQNLVFDQGGARAGALIWKRSNGRCRFWPAFPPRLTTRSTPARPCSSLAVGPITCCRSTSRRSGAGSRRRRSSAFPTPATGSTPNSREPFSISSSRFSRPVRSSSAAGRDLALVVTLGV